MSDLFDEFLREVERRRAAAEGREPAAPGPDDADDDPSSRGAGADEEPQPLRGGGARRGASGGSGGPRRPGGPRDGAGSLGGFVRRAGIGLVLGVGLLIAFAASSGIDLWTDAIWFDSIGYGEVFWQRLSAQSALFAAALLVGLVVLVGNLWLAGRLAPPPDPDRPGTFRSFAERIAEAQARAERGGGPYAARRPGGAPPATLDLGDLPDLGPAVVWGIGAVAAFVALGIAGSVAGAWEAILLWANRVPYSTAGLVPDPVFGRDISYFLFELPLLRIVQTLVNWLLLASLLVAGARYFVAATNGSEVLVTRVRVHLAALAGLYLLSVAFGYQLDKYELVYSQAGVATGVAYTDENARFLAYDVLTFLSGIAGALLVGGAFTRWLWPLGAVVAVWMSASLVLGTLYPEAIQRFTVDPNTYAQEERYIANNIAMTRLAFGLEEWETRQYAGDAELTQEAIADEAATFANARLWDYRPLQTTLDQLQTVRQYYDFVDVDTDRYLVDGQLRQVMLSARELAIERNPQATSWVNQRIIYTHGIGVVMVPVNEVTREGQPRLWIRDLPPASSEGAPEVTEPRIYFGEADSHYVVVGARQAEFDYPRDTSAGTSDETTSWAGSDGVPLGSTLNRLLFALRFGDLDLLISDQILAESQLLFHRTISERVDLLAPFLVYDKDPYLVIDDAGRLVYVQDAYTVSDRFPHATWFDGSELPGASGFAGSAFNYVRNSVKITMDAYDGTMRLHVADPSDPLIRAWSAIFPGLFRPLDELPADLAAHVRVPEELFNIQARVYGRYHVTQPLTFFQNADRWTVPAGQKNEQTLPTEAYYVVMRMPGEPEAEFLLLQPMIAASRPNMIAWVAARNDGDDYGKVRVYQFPADTTIFGPEQIEARIDQDPTISAQVTLWDQSGSRVIRGNLIVVPVDDSLLYLQPVYLQSTSAAFPEFQKIIVASPTTIVWGDSLDEALRLLLEAEGGTGPGPTSGPSPDGTPAPTLPPDGELPGDVEGLIAYANVHFEAAQAALRAGDFATYGAEIAKVERALQRLGELTATPRP